MRAFRALLVALLVWGAMSFGAVYPWGYWPLAAGGAVLGVWGIVATKAWQDPRPRLIAWALGGVAAAMALQLIPLPIAWFRALSPGAHALLAQLEFGYAANPPAWHAVSVAPRATLTALTLLLAFSLFLLGLMRTVSHLPLRWLVSQVMSFGVALALFGIGQRVVLGSQDFLVYGFWKPTSGLATPFGPFVNRNHFAGWMIMALPLVAAYAGALAQESRGPFGTDWRSWLRWLAAPDASRFVFVSGAALVMAVALVLTGSRSGLGSLAIALIVLGIVSATHVTGRWRRLLLVFCLAVLSLAAVGWAGLGRTVARFERVAEELSERTAAWQDTLKIIRDFPLTGTGFGGFGQAMLVYQTTDRSAIYKQAHNDYLQVVAEGGGLVAIPAAIAVLALGRIIRLRFRRREDDALTQWIRAGAVAGLAGIAVQSVLEFSLQMPGNALMFLVICALAMHRPSGIRHARRI